MSEWPLKRKSIAPYLSLCKTSFTYSMNIKIPKGYNLENDVLQGPDENVMNALM